ATEVAEVVVAGDSTRAARAVGAGSRAGDLRVAGGAAGRAGQVGRPLAVDKAAVACRDGRHRGTVDAIRRAGGGHAQRCLADLEAATDVAEVVVAGDSTRAARAVGAGTRSEERRVGKGGRSRVVADR